MLTRKCQLDRLGGLFWCYLLSIEKQNENTIKWGLSPRGVFSTVMLSTLSGDLDLTPSQGSLLIPFQPNYMVRALSLLSEGALEEWQISRTKKRLLLTLDLHCVQFAELISTYWVDTFPVRSLNYRNILLIWIQKLLTEIKTTRYGVLYPCHLLWSISHLFYDILRRPPKWFSCHTFRFSLVFSMFYKLIWTWGLTMAKRSRMKEGKL